jgi:hypothetical protein
LAYVVAQNGDLAQSQQLYLQALTLDNRMRAAAEAAIQIQEKEATKNRLAAIAPNANASAPAENTNKEPVRLPTLPAAATPSS